MPITQLFINSIISPKKIAAFRLLPIGKVMIYVFIFIAIFTFISFMNFISDFEIEQSTMSGLLEYVDDMKWILLPLAFIIQFVMSTLMVFTHISLMALVGMGLVKGLKRRGEYRHVWRSTTFAYTLPTLVMFLLLAMLVPELIAILLINFLSLIYLILSIRYYPKIK